MAITATQSRAARALLGLTQPDLAERSGVSLRTVANFETDQTRPIRSVMAALQQALEQAGIVFIGEDGGGLGVRLVKGFTRCREMRT